MTLNTFAALVELKTRYIQAVEAEAVIEAALMENPDNEQLKRDYEISANCTDRLREDLRRAGVVKW